MFPTDVTDLGRFALDEWHEIRVEHVTWGNGKTDFVSFVKIKKLYKSRKTGRWVSREKLNIPVESYKRFLKYLKLLEKELDSF
jgi:hypothetical protein